MNGSSGGGADACVGGAEREARGARRAQKGWATATGEALFEGVGVAAEDGLDLLPSRENGREKLGHPVVWYGLC